MGHMNMYVHTENPVYETAWCIHNFTQLFQILNHFSIILSQIYGPLLI